MAVTPELTAEQHQRRRILSRAWALLVMTWAVGRTIVVWAALSEYGINPWIYLVIDLVCASVDTFTTPKTVLALIDGKYKDAAMWGTASLIAFIVPDIYIFLGTDHLPRSIIIIVCVIIAITLTFTVVTVVRKVRKGRAERAALALISLETGVQVTDANPPATT